MPVASCRTDFERIERGWAGHFIGSDNCRFRRNTLLKLGSTRIVISTVGSMLSLSREGKFDEIGYKRFYETMAFHAKRDKHGYWDADVGQEVTITGKTAIRKIEPRSDRLANEMHEATVSEIADRMKAGEIA